MKLIVILYLLCINMQIYVSFSIIRSDLMIKNIRYVFCIIVFCCCVLLEFIQFTRNGGFVHARDIIIISENLSMDLQMIISYSNGKVWNRYLVSTSLDLFLIENNKNKSINKDLKMIKYSYDHLRSILNRCIQTYSSATNNELRHMLPNL